MASTINYSKWDHIDISDDEDDTHPNIDTPSLFRWRHQARLDKMAAAEKEKKELQSAHTKHQQELEAVKQKLKETSLTGGETAEDLARKAAELEMQEVEFRRKEEELRKKEQMTPLNIDTICHEGKSKSIINKPKPKPTVKTDEEKLEEQREFFDKYEKQMKKYGMFQRYDDSAKYLQENSFLVSEYTANYLVVWCVNLQVEEKSTLMEHVAHQTIVMQFILELARTLDVDPRSCVNSFFARIKLGEKQYMDAFNDELTMFKDRIRARAEQKIADAMEEYEKEERQKRLGPGGLDPQEVFPTLPKELQECFESRDTDKLKAYLATMSEADAIYHMKRCVDSGLWCPEGENNPLVTGEEIYSEIDDGAISDDTAASDNVPALQKLADEDDASSSQLRHRRVSADVD